MKTLIDLNADAGESFGRWKLGDDDALLPLVSSVNVACGWHAGDPATMRRSVELATTHRVALGAHPGLPDLAGFGRRSMALSATEAADACLYQYGALRGFADAAGVRITHIADDWSAGRLELNLRWWNRNMHGAGFGGTLFSMTDVLFGTLVMGRLGSDYEAWTRTGTFQYLSPGRRGAYLDVEVTDELLAWMKEVVAEDGYCNVPYTSVIYNKDGSVAGIGQQDLHVRPRRSGKLAHLKRAPEPKHATEARGLVLESLANAVLWHCFKQQPSVLTSLMSRQRRMPQPDEQMRMVVSEVLEREAATREELLKLGVAEKFLD